MNERQCTRDDLYVEVVADLPVRHDGQPDSTEIGRLWDMVNYEPYACRACGTEFDTIEEALEHVATQEAA